MKTASEMTYTVSSGALNSTQTNHPTGYMTVHKVILSVLLTAVNVIFLARSHNPGGNPVLQNSQSQDWKSQSRIAIPN